MNRYAQNIITAFTSQQNMWALRMRLSDHFKDPAVDSFLSQHLAQGMYHFRETIVRDAGMSDPLPGITIADQLDAYNVQFLRGYVKYIRDHVRPESITSYTVSDGLPTSRYGTAHHAKSAAHILDTWSANSGRQVQIREDSGADAGTPTYYAEPSALQTGITFCDQAHLGTQNHIEQYENRSYKVALNSMIAPHERTAFGVSSVDSDARLAGRRCRSDGGVRRREVSLQRRYVERDVAEAMRGAEKDCINRGYDMSGLRAKTDYNASRRAVGVEARSRLQYH